MSLEQTMTNIATEAATNASETVVRRALEQLMTIITTVVVRVDDDQFLTLEETSEYLRVSIPTARALAQELGLQPVGQQWRIPKWTLRRYLDPQLISVLARL